MKNLKNGKNIKKTKSNFISTSTLNSTSSLEKGNINKQDKLDLMTKIVKKNYSKSGFENQDFFYDLKKVLKTGDVSNSKIKAFIEDIIEELIIKDSLWKIFKEISVSNSLEHFIKYNTYDLVKDINYMFKQKIDIETINIFIIIKIIRQLYYAISFSKYQYQDVFFKNILKATFFFLVGGIIITIFIVKNLLKYLI